MDFPALSTEINSPHPSLPEAAVGTPTETSQLDLLAMAKVEKKAAKKAAAAERALERAKVAQEKAAAKAAEKAKLAQEKAAERERATALKEEKELLQKEKIEKEKAVKERLRAERVAADVEKEAALKLEHKKASQIERERTMQAKAAATQKKTKTAAQAFAASAEPAGLVKSANHPSVRNLISSPVVTNETMQAPLLSKMPKKNKPITKPIRIPREEEVEDLSATISAATPDTPLSAAPRPSATVESSINNSRAQSVDRGGSGEPTSVAELLEEIDLQHPSMDLPNHPFFDTYKLNPAAKMPLEYGPLVHALSALSVGGGSFANNMPSGSIDNAVSSFQQLLETLTQTISDLLRLLPRTTWDDSSSFDGVLRDMLKGDDFLDDGRENSPGKEDEVAALTLALERRARWMEVQLSKLEELHRDINTAAVRAVLSFNDNGWDRYAFMPRIGSTLRRFDTIGTVAGKDGPRPMTADELEDKLAVAREAAVFAEAEVREVMEKMAAIRPFEDEEIGEHEDDL
ncbi:hypothetical protein HWV62_44987 [Athelia sp. TMB]|nr:hypothetical protein HWV62_23310 [Athelia sp. TMB]KAF7978710.1 hypothetical protein HWV62_44987 [Athelia sp. TMB]